MKTQELETKEIKIAYSRSEIEDNSCPELIKLLITYGMKKLNKEELKLPELYEIFQEEFVDFILPLAKENFLQGYKVAIDDIGKMQKGGCEGCSCTHDK